MTENNWSTQRQTPKWQNWQSPRWYVCRGPRGANNHQICSWAITEISLPEGSEIPGLTEETDQMVVSVNAPKAVEEEPVIDEVEDGEGQEAEDASEDTGGDKSDSAEENTEKESSEES